MESTVCVLQELEIFGSCRLNDSVILVMIALIKS